MNLKKLGHIIIKSFQLLKKSQPLFLSASTAFFMLFSLAPIIIISINILSLYFQQDVISTQVYDRLEYEFGQGTAQQVEQIVSNFKDQASSVWITIGGTLFLIFVATTLFHVIRLAINRIWHIRTTKSMVIRHNLKQRSISFLLIIIGGLLFAASLLANTAVAFLHDYLDQLIPSVDAAIIVSINIIISLLVVTLWFAILFKYLPDVTIPGKYAIIGGLVTAILFDIGKFLLGRFLITENLNNMFGASASIMLLLLFIFYSSMIMYFGASFTMVYAQESGASLTPKKNAESYKIVSANVG